MEPDAICGNVSIKCPRCGAFNNLRPSRRELSPSPKRPDRDGNEASCGSSSHRTT
ncbi:MAG: hypothetical protein COC12_08930 [Rhodobacteraceae bacterium]|nr:MAG: hypothetical protein COC12_08930 [Paracoccaceae bacterium]